MNKIDKFLKKLSVPERSVVEEIVSLILGELCVGLDIKKMKGYDSRYRVRKGKIRIIFTVHVDQIYIEKIDFRSETTY